jgi:hypothetical protein
MQKCTLKCNPSSNGLYLRIINTTDKAKKYKIKCNQLIRWVGFFYFTEKQNKLKLIIGITSKWMQLCLVADGKVHCAAVGWQLSELFNPNSLSPPSRYGNLSFDIVLKRGT